MGSIYGLAHEQKYFQAPGPDRFPLGYKDPPLFTSVSELGVYGPLEWRALLPASVSLQRIDAHVQVGPPQESFLQVLTRMNVRVVNVTLSGRRRPFPTIHIRTPYTKAEGRPVGEFFTRYGYAVAVQDVRGRHASEGESYPSWSEVADGVDMTRWISQQPWCNGKIGAFCGSYVGFTQWAMAVGNPALSSIAPAFITVSLYSGIHRAGAFGKLTFLRWSLTSYGRCGNTAVLFQAGHRIRLEISSSNFPRYDLNPNTGRDIVTERNPIPATQKVFCGTERPSALIMRSFHTRRIRESPAKDRP